MPTFFFSNNPIALFLALVVVLVVLKTVFEKRNWFKEGDRSTYITPILIAIAVFLVAYTSLLKILSIAIPFLAVLVLFLVLLGTALYCFGMPEKAIWPAMKKVGPLRTALVIAVFCIIAFAVSTVYGDKLLDDKSVSIADAMTPAQEPVEINFAPLFTSQALGMIFIVIVLGFTFVFINFAR